MPITSRKLRVFLCHSSQDKPIVRELYEQLNGDGWIDPWLDEEKLLPGQDWDMEIEKAIEFSDVVIVVLSNNSVSKEGVVQKEIRRALDKAEERPEDIIFIIPLRIEDCPVPRRLKVYQYQDYFPSEYRRSAYQQLSKSLETRAYGLGINVVEVRAQVKKIIETEEENKAQQRISKDMEVKSRQEKEKRWRVEIDKGIRTQLINDQSAKSGSRVASSQDASQYKVPFWKWVIAALITVLMVFILGTIHFPVWLFVVVIFVAVFLIYFVLLI